MFFCYSEYYAILVILSLLLWVTQIGAQLTKLSQEQFTPSYGMSVISNVSNLTR